jgi:hypothetical protein
MRKRIPLGLVVALATVVAVRVLSGHAQTASPEIFCSALPAGQLCPHGTTQLLKLDGAKKQSWNEAVNQYNKTVDSATKRLLAQAKASLSPEELATVQKWFDNSVNAQLDRQLLAQPKADNDAAQTAKEERP